MPPLAGTASPVHSTATDILLDNPIWHSLTTGHAVFATGDDRARRYPASIGPLAGAPALAPANYAALRELAGPEGVLGLFCQEPAVPPPGWTLLRDGLLSQMVSPTPTNASPTELPPQVFLRELTQADVPAMLALTQLTEPGPFREDTITLGRFWGIFENTRLLAMAGQRLHLPAYIEVSAVCTHPDARGRGYARLLMSTAMDDIRRRGKTPFLHTWAHNAPAIRVYESLGFRLRRQFHLAVLKNDQ